MRSSKCPDDLSPSEEKWDEISEKAKELGRVTGAVTEYLESQEENNVDEEISISPNQNWMPPVSVYPLRLD